MSDRRKIQFSRQISEIPMTERPVSSGVSRSKSINIKENQLRTRRVSLGPIEDLVQCIFCMGKLNDPRMLPCQHTFCLCCLQSHLGSGNQDIIKCPACDETINLPDGFQSLEELPSNLYIDSLLKLLANSPKTKALVASSEIRCINCQIVCETPSQHYCRHCKQVFCSVCWSQHVLQLNKQMKLLLVQIDKSFERLDHRLEDFDAQCEQLDDSVRKTAELKVEEVKIQEKKCLEQLDDLKVTAVNSAEALRKKMIELQEKILDQSSSVVNDDNTKINDFMMFHRETSSLLDELSHWGECHPIFDRNAFKIDFESYESIGEDVEDVTVEVKGIQNPLKDQETLAMYYQSRSFTPRMIWSKHLRPSRVVFSPWAPNCLYVTGTDSRIVLCMDYCTGKLKQRLSCPDMIYPAGIALSRKDEKIYVSDKWKHCIHVFKINGECIKRLGKKGSADGQFRSPDGIAIDTENRLFVCDSGNDRIQVIDPESEKVFFQLGIVGSRKDPVEIGSVINYTELNGPTEIAVTDSKIIVADSGNCRIKLYSLDGKKISEFGTFGKNRGQFRSPETLTVDPMGFILVGDSGNARIQIFKPDGQLVRVFNNEGKFGWISGLCVTPQLDIVVTDYKTHNIYVF